MAWISSRDVHLPLRHIFNGLDHGVGRLECREMSDAGQRSELEMGKISPSRTARRTGMTGSASPHITIVW
jgi:hypothetical protein